MIVLPLQGKKKVFLKVLQATVILGLAVLVFPLFNEPALTWLLDNIYVYFTIMAIMFIVAFINKIKGDFKTELLWDSPGDIVITNHDITFDGIKFPTAGIKKITFIINGVKGEEKGSGRARYTHSGSGNVLEITTHTGFRKRKFLLLNSYQKELIRNFCLRLKENGITVYVEGMELKKEDERRLF